MRRPRVPIAMPIVIIVLLVLGIIALNVIPNAYTPEQLAKNVLLAAVPFVLIFVSILLTYITLIAALATSINDLMNPRRYGIIMNIVIACILLGILGMFQSFAMQLYTRGFMLLFITTLIYIAWSHVRPAPEASIAEVKEAVA